MESIVSVEIHLPHVAVVTIHRSDARNAVNGAVASQLGAIVEGIESDDNIWAAILTGEGGVSFCAGADLKEVAAGRLSTLFTELGGFAGFVRYPRQKLWIAAVEGFAMAGGFELALACDLIVAASGARFALPEVKRGLIASAGGLFRLPRTLPRVIANELIATGEALSATRAAELGMVNFVSADGDALRAALDFAQRITANAPIAVRESLAVARRSLDLDPDALFDFSEERQSQVMLTEDFAEGPRAFIEKRAPKWVGR